MAGIDFIARAVFRKDGEILLAHKIGESNNFLPAGHIEPEEYAKAALSRELAEELGLGYEIGDFVGVLEHKFTDRHGTAYEEVNLIFETSIETFNMTSVEGHMECIWSSPGEMTFRNLFPVVYPRARLSRYCFLRYRTPMTSAALSGVV